MKPVPFHSGWSHVLLAMSVAAGAAPILVVAQQGAPAAASDVEPTVVYSTQFEESEGYDPEFTLAGQNEWVAFGTGGNGLVSGFFPEEGQHAFVGFTPPEDEEEVLNVWRPVNVAPIDPEEPLVKFSVLMEIVDSTETNAHYDDFRWSVYNTNDHRLFTLDFDNRALDITYLLDDPDQGFISTGFGFEHGGLYELEMTMNFERNLWSATFNGTRIVNAQPITTTDAELNLGDVDAVWAIFDSQNPGDNFMVFDNYRITSRPDTSMPPELQAVEHLDNGQFLLRVTGEPNRRYVVEATANFEEWSAIKTNSAPDGIFDFLDTQAPDFENRYYRVREPEAP